MQRTAIFLNSVLVTALLVLAAAVPAGAATPAFGRYLTVRFADGTSASERSHLRATEHAAHRRSLNGPQLQQIELPAGVSADRAAERLEHRAGVEFVVAPGEYRADALPDPYFDDPLLPSQWALKNSGQVFMTLAGPNGMTGISGTPTADINAPVAWDALDSTARAREVRLGIVDTGVAYEHQDLAANMLRGKDFYDGDDDPRDYDGHGTHVASIAVAAGDNGVGISGVDPWAKAMPLRASNEEGVFSWAAIDAAVSYGLANGVKVFNGSFGGPDDDPAIESLIAANPGVLFVFSAGNGGSDALGDNHDAANGLGHRFPCDSPLNNVICVGASDWNDQLASFSDYGTSSVDLLAPGASVYAAKPCTTPATDVNDQGECPYDADDPTAPVGLGGGPFAFRLLSGTSMAAPAVAGTAALLWQKCPGLKASQVKTAIVSTVHQLPAVRTKVAYGGRLDAGAALLSVGNCTGVADNGWPVPPPQPAPPGSDGGGGQTGPTGNPPQNPTGDAKPDQGLTFQIIRPRSARVARRSKVSFKLKCSTVCSARITARPLAHGVTFKHFKVKVARRHSGTRVVRVKLPRASLKAIRALLAGRQKVRLRLSVVVSDAAGAASKPVAFTIQLRR